MPTTSADKRRIARNTLMLYLRMLLSTAVSLYTSRVILATLGVEDFGISGLVGGVVGMFTFINTSMAGATSRFLTYELGRGDEGRLRDTFGSALLAHILIALGILVLAETVGLWIVETKLIIPEGRMVAARWVYQFAIFGMIVGVTQVPYNATLIAHERMDIYAYVELANVVLKLLVVYLLVVAPFDKLILYSALHLSVSVGVALFYRFYCLRHFRESRTLPLRRPAILKPLLTFSGWDLCHSGCRLIRMQCTAILINRFFGVALNAACSIALIVEGVIIGLVTNVTGAFRPQIIKNYSQGDIPSMTNLLILSSKAMLLPYCACVFPLCWELNFVFDLWLTEVPAKSVLICRVILLVDIFTVFHAVVSIPFHATGCNKLFSVQSSVTSLLVLAAIYLSFRLGLGVEWAYYCSGFFSIVLLAANFRIITRYIPTFSRRYFLAQVWICMIPLFILLLLGLYGIRLLLPQGWLRLLLSVAFSVAATSGYAYAFVLNRDQRRLLLSRLPLFKH